MINIKAISESSIKEAADIIRSGGVAVLPTDTNYNVVTSPFSLKGAERIFDMKKRESLSPLTLFLGDSLELHDYTYLTPETEKLAKMLWPEKISFILYQKNIVPSFVTRGFGTVAVTLHSNYVLRKIAHLVGTPLAGTSANLSGTGNVPNVRKAVEHIGDYVDIIIDGGVSEVDGANTIIDFTFNPPLLARAGAFPVSKLKELIPNLNSSLDSVQYKTLVKNRALQI